MTHRKVYAKYHESLKKCTFNSRLKIRHSFSGRIFFPNSRTSSGPNYSNAGYLYPVDKFLSKTKIYLTLHIGHDFLLHLSTRCAYSWCIFIVTRVNTEIFTEIETKGYSDLSTG